VHEVQHLAGDFDVEAVLLDDRAELAAEGLALERGFRHAVSDRALGRRETRTRFQIRAQAHGTRAVVELPAIHATGANT
jgi:hypothetical protein